MSAVDELEVEPLELDLPEPEKSWPVVVEVTTRYVVWAEGESAKSAADYLARDGYEELGELTKHAEADLYNVETRPAEDYEVSNYPAAGPPQTCTECGDVAHGSLRPPLHLPACSLYVHRVRIVERRYGETGWRFTCWCPTLDPVAWRDTREAAEADLAAHVAGKLHEVQP